MQLSATVAIIGGFGLGNFGDDLLMLATQHVLRRVVPAEQITVLLYPGGRRYAPRLQADLRYVERREPIELTAQLVVLGGGTQFYGFGSQQLRRSVPERTARYIQALRQGRMSWRNLFTASRTTVTLAPTCRQAAVSLGLGPFLNEPAEDRARDAVGKCEYLAVRDSSSLAFCQKWGLHQACLRSDWGFAPQLWGGTFPTSSAMTRQGRIGIIVRDWYKSAAGFAHLHACLELAATLRREGREVQFFVFDACEDTTCLRELRRHNERVVVWQPERMQVSEQLEKLLACDLLVTARAHGAIVAATLGRPAVCVEIEPKLNIMASLLGRAAECWRPPFQVQEGMALVDSMENRWDEACRTARELSQHHARSAEQAAEELAAFTGQCVSADARSPVTP
jgi:polysaccharide pyruvyl transferase WcaK-like protein